MDVQKDPERNETKNLLEYADVRAKRILEVGCGDGRLTWRYAATAQQVAGIDLDRDSLRVARIERPSDMESRITFAEANSVHLPFRDKCFDLAIFAWSF
jgi:ubiquinone/menaquinone biosynthesis C-methylase UbiE